MDQKRVTKACLKVKSKNSWVGSILILLLAGLSHPALSQERTPLKSIRIGMPNRGVPNLSLMAAQHYGFFRTQGLEAELIVMRPSISLQTLMAGDWIIQRSLPPQRALAWVVFPSVSSWR